MSVSVSVSVSVPWNSSFSASVTFVCRVRCVDKTEYIVIRHQLNENGRQKVTPSFANKYHRSRIHERQTHARPQKFICYFRRVSVWLYLENETGKVAHATIYGKVTLPIRVFHLIKSYKSSKHKMARLQ